MFNAVVENIISRYSREELSKRYSVDLPDKKKNNDIYQYAKNTNLEKIDVAYYETINSNKFISKTGLRGHATIINEKNSLFLEYRLSWLEKLILMFHMFIEGIKQKILSFFKNLFSKFKLPPIVNNILFAIILIPFMILGALIAALSTIRSAPGGILGIVIGILMFIFVLVGRIVMIPIEMIITALVSKLADKWIDKPLIKRLIIGKFMKSSYLGNAEIIITDNMINEVNFETSKSFIGSDKLYYTILEGDKVVTLKDRLLSKVFDDYIVNRRFIINIEEKDKDKFLNIFTKDKEVA